MKIQDRLDALEQAGYTVGVGSRGGDEEPISYRVIGFGIDLAIPVDGADDFLDSIEGSHDDRAAEEAHVDQDELDAATEQRGADASSKRKEYDAAIDEAELPDGIKALLRELVADRY